MIYYIAVNRTTCLDMFMHKLGDEIPKLRDVLIMFLYLFLFMRVSQNYGQKNKSIVIYIDTRWLFNTC